MKDSPSHRDRIVQKIAGGPADLSGLRLMDADLSGLDLSYCNFTGADLSRANLSNANCLGAFLENAVLYEANLQQTEFMDARLAGANLCDCDANKAGFSRADLSGVQAIGGHFENAVFIGATLNDADLCGAKMNHARFHGAQLNRTLFQHTGLQGADLSETQLAGAKFAGTDFRGAHLRNIEGYLEADWIGADIRNVDFNGAYLARRFILDENYLHEFKHSTPLNGLVYKLWWLTSDCGRNLLRWSLFTLGITSIYAIIFLFIDIDWGPHSGPFSSMYFSIVTLTSLGYGEIVPSSTVAQIIVSTQVIVGYVLLGGLISILSNKMARRAD